MRSPRVGKEDGEIRSQGHPRRDVSSSPAQTKPVQNFALHFPPPAITLSKFWEEFYMECPTPSFFEPAPDDLTRREFLGAMLTTSLLAGVAGAELWPAAPKTAFPIEARPKRRTRLCDWHRRLASRYSVRRTG